MLYRKLWFRIRLRPRRMNGEGFLVKALKYDLVLVPGDTFGAPGYFRMAYCIDTEKVERSLAALRRFVAEEYGAK